jgi:hypothetical protein
MFDGEVAVRVAANMIRAEPQFKRPVFQTIRFDQ